MIIAGIVFCILCAGFFAGMETGLVASNQMKIYTEREKGKIYARAAYFLLHKPDRLLATTLIGTNLVVVTATLLLILLVRSSPLPACSEWFAVFGLTLVILIFSEIFPKSFFRNHADTVTLRFAPALVFFYVLFLPVSVALNAVVRSILFVFGKHRHVKKTPRSREDLRMLLKLRARELSLSALDQRLIDGLFDFPDTRAREVMIPLNRTPVVDLKTPLSEVVRIAGEAQARFIPVYAHRSDNIIGYVDIEDFLCRGKERDLKFFLKEAFFYPETKRIPGLLMEMNGKNQDLVFLCDEYGMISGISTADEIIADIFGHIPGEEAEGEEDIRSVGHERFIAFGTADVDDVVRRTGVAIEKGAYDTIGGFLCDKLGEIPKIGTVYAGKGALFRILERDKRQIKKIEIQKTDTDE